MNDSFKDIWELRQPGRRDSQRHKERIKKAIKENLRELIAEENIISSDGKRKVKVPVRYLDMWRFKLGSNRNGKGVGHGDGDPGDIIAKDTKRGKGKGKAGDQPGEEIYEEEVELAEIVEMMLEDLGLPWLENKENQVEIETEEMVFHDISEKGLPPNVDIKRTLLENLKRNSMAGKPSFGKIVPDDLRYRVWENVIEKHSNAAVILIMDRSGSMTDDKKYIVKSFFFWMVSFLRLKYGNVDVVFIAHDTEAREVEEANFFAISDGGGTRISSGLELAKTIIETRFPTNLWNNYIFSFSDGENWDNDNEHCIDLFKELLGMCQAVGYGEVEYSDQFYKWSGWRGSWSTLHDVLEKDEELTSEQRFLMASIVKREDVYKCLQQFLNMNGKEHP
jgi:sporulation protein YhbH